MNRDAQHNLRSDTQHTRELCSESVLREKTRPVVKESFISTVFNRVRAAAVSAIAFVFMMMIMAVAVVPAFGQGFTIPAGSELMVNTGTFNVCGDLTIEGTLQTSTGGVQLTGDWINVVGVYSSNTGSVIFNGTGTQNLTPSGTGAGKLFYNVGHTGTSELDLVGGNLNVNGSFSNTNGTFDTNNLDITVAGDWRNTGTFVAGTSAVTLDGTNQTIYGSSTFNILTKSVTIADTLFFDHTGTQSVTGTLTLTGTIGNTLTLNSTDDDGTPTQAGLTLVMGGTSGN